MENKTLTPDTEHAYFSPSASDRWIGCPASLLLYEKLEKENTSKYAAEGTICHEIAADCLVNKTEAAEHMGKVVEGVTITPELVEGMQLYVDEVKGLTKEFDAIGGRIEQKVKINNDCWGTIDAMIWSKDTLVVIDLKMGSGVVVQAQDNNQLRIYSAGALKWLYEKHKMRPKKIVNYIIQPRTPNPIRKAEYTTKEILQFMRDIVVPIYRMKQSGELAILPCNPGEVQCRWCRIKNCKARAQKAITDASKAFAPFTQVELPGINISNDKKELDIAELAELKKSFKFINDWISSTDKYMLTIALDGEYIPGYKLVEGRANHKWGVKEDRVVKLFTSLGKEPYIKKLVSPAQAEKAIGKKVAKAHNLDTFIIKPKGKPTLVEESDKRPELKPNNTKENIEKEFSIDSPAEPVGVPIIVNTPAEESYQDSRPISVMEKMRMVDIDDEIATSSNQEEVNEIEQDAQIERVDRQKLSDEIVEEKRTLNNSAMPGVPPKKGTKRRIIFDIGISSNRDRTITSVANELDCSENMVRMHLRYVNERDGFNYIIYSDDTFVIFSE